MKYLARLRDQTKGERRAAYAKGKAAGAVRQKERLREEALLAVQDNTSTSTGEPGEISDYEFVDAVTGLESRMEDLDVMEQKTEEEVRVEEGRSEDQAIMEPESEELGEVHGVTVQSEEGEVWTPSIRPVSEEQVKSKETG